MLKVILGIVILAISASATQYSNILDVYGGGGRLFGGTYLLLFYIGMIIAPYLIVRWKKIYLYGTVIGASFLWILWYHFTSINQFQLDSRFPFGKGINPPGVTLMCYVVIVLLWAHAFFSVCENSGNKVINACVNVIRVIGENSLYILLCHRLILDYFLMPYVSINNIWLKRVVYLGCMILLPILNKESKFYTGLFKNVLVKESARRSKICQK